ncbi:hypothetical protein, partial [Xenorhabdus bovienii]|uniref:hypothetical protein n=1 Tax=Xenorhabdus bovienii TaxID=40576 RepID=UPI0023B32AE0
LDQTPPLYYGCRICLIGNCVYPTADTIRQFLLDFYLEYKPTFFLTTIGRNLPEKPLVEHIFLPNGKVSSIILVL